MINKLKIYLFVSRKYTNVTYRHTQRQTDTARWRHCDVFVILAPDMNILNIQAYLLDGIGRAYA